ncbi:DUF7133 domain-containing protein [Gimesia benthica]
MLQDGDGRLDKSVVFADQSSWPTSVCCYDGGVFVFRSRAGQTAMSFRV